MLYSSSLFLLVAASQSTTTSASTLDKSSRERIYNKNRNLQFGPDYETAPCYPCGPNGFTTTPDHAPDFFFNIEGEPLTCAWMYNDLVGGNAVSEQDCDMFMKEFFGELCGCASSPTISPAPTISPSPTQSPTVSMTPTVAPCYLCGAGGMYVEIDWNKEVEVPELGGPTPCWQLDQMAYSIGFVFEDDFYTHDDDFYPSSEDALTCDVIQEYAKECGCPPTEPTISPAPTISPPPSQSPTVSMTPTATPCYLCGAGDMYVEIDWEKNVNVPELGGPTPCWQLEQMAYFVNYVFDDDYTYDDDFSSSIGTLTCDGIQEHAKECGCPNTEPTISPGPTISPPPSQSPTVSMTPTVAPCHLCGATVADFNDAAYWETYWESLEWDKEINVPELGVTTCGMLDELAYWVGTSFDDDFTFNDDFYPPMDAMTCDGIQTYGQTCGCPQIEPTVSPRPTTTPQPSPSPTIPPAPTAPCSCETNCNGGNEQCGCFCDSICEELGDCCSDVKDYCDFSQFN